MNDTIALFPVIYVIFNFKFISHKLFIRHSNRCNIIECKLKMKMNYCQLSYKLIDYVFYFVYYLGKNKLNKLNYMSSSSYSRLPSSFPYHNYASINELDSFNSPKKDIQRPEIKNQNNPQAIMLSRPQHMNMTDRQINNQFYTQTANKPTFTSSNSNSFKLKQMSSDLAKLKQQLSKIMNQAQKFDKKSRTSSQSLQTHISLPNYPKLSHEQVIEQEKTSLVINTKDNFNTLSPSRNESPFKKTQKFQYEQEKLDSNLLNSKDYRLNNIFYSEKKRSNKELFERQKSINFNSKDYFTEIVKQFETPIKISQSVKINQEKIPNQQKAINNIQSNSALKIQTEVTPKQNKKTQLEKIEENKIKPQKIEENKNVLNLTEQKNNLFNKIEGDSKLPTIEPVFAKKSSSNVSHELIVTKIVNEQLSKKIESNFEAQQLRKKKQQEQLQYQQRIIELEHEKRKMKHQLSNALLEKQNSETQLKNEKSQKESLLQKAIELEELLKTNKSELEEYKVKCRLLQRKLQDEISRPKLPIQSYTFDENLKRQLIQIKKFKDKIQQKDEEIMMLKDLNITHRREIDSLNNQIKIQQLKAASQVNECEMKHSIAIQDKENELRSFKNLIETLEAKLEVAVKQNKSKDAFMVQHLTGKAKTEDDKAYVERFFSDYRTQFPVNRISEKLKEQQLQIERLKKAILQMAAIKN